jgi:hypothetical protein
LKVARSPNRDALLFTSNSSGLSTLMFTD